MRERDQKGQRQHGEEERAEMPQRVLARRIERRRLHGPEVIRDRVRDRVPPIAATCRWPAWRTTSSTEAKSSIA
jgi:hypothetical protein